MGRGCPECAGHKLSNTLKFIEKAKKIHRNLFDYTNANYITSIEDVSIKCNGCNNMFYQTPSEHLSGHGCRRRS